MDKILFGVAYYDEYMPFDRLFTDVEMMKNAGINVVRIAESTWSTLEPQSGIFDFTSLDHVLDAMNDAEIKVIVGTPTYAVPTWMVKEHPEILAETPEGPSKYGCRQIMDITSPAYLFYCERVIRKLLSHVCMHPAVIGYQADNETKHYDTCGSNVQFKFLKYLKDKFQNVDAINSSFGFDYWSNRINSWEDCPSAVGSINASFSCEFAKFQRKLVTDFLSWQVSIINDYKHTDQFVTQNFDLEWRGFSYGYQPDVDQFEAAKKLDVAGVDIYHLSEDKLTGIEISLGGDIARSLKRKNYFVIETQAQGQLGWQPYPGQLRLQAFSHLASGANMLSYWHWHSIHNSAETYWKGILSHDFEPNETYEEVKSIGCDLQRFSGSLINLKKRNKIAMLISNEALTAFNAFKPSDGIGYNDVMRLMYDMLYRLNLGCDFISSNIDNFDDYKLIIVPALYAAPNSLLMRINNFIKCGGHAVLTFKSGFCDENVKVRHIRQPGIISEACGVYYDQFTVPHNVSLKGGSLEFSGEDSTVSGFMELLTPITAEVLAYYNHAYWGKYAAATQNAYGKGLATYIGCLTSKTAMERIIKDAVKKADLWGADQNITFPTITKFGVNENGRVVHYYFNYSGEPKSLIYPHRDGKDLLTDTKISQSVSVELAPWGIVIVEENCGAIG